MTAVDIAEYVRDLVAEAPPLPDRVVELLTAAPVGEVVEHDAAA